MLGPGLRRIKSLMHHVVMTRRAGGAVGMNTIARHEELDGSTMDGKSIRL